ncbi:hypothetical protein KPL71_014556 [Citrus sinensis]|uniref:Uncharacterized protein n=1 Tax=Citrus sinensis TaxID=2711 RepID=A0ACB8KCE1_CITSI|nr:hypothetical protein KPL71_014556 [Citrus sinensis]
MHQVFEKMTKRFEEIGSQLRQHGAALRAFNRSKLVENPVDEYEVDNKFWKDDRASKVNKDRVTYRKRRQERYRRDYEDRDLGKIEVTIPSFQVKSDPEAYLEWEKKVELIFDCHNYSEVKKVKLAVIEFTNYTIIWWDQLVNNKRRNRERPVVTWGELRE